MLRHLQAVIAAISVFCGSAQAGEQQYEPLSASVSATLHQSMADNASPRLAFTDEDEGRAWLADMSARLEKRIPDLRGREDFLTTVHYEATRAGLDPQLVLGIIQVESDFRKYALSRAGARGYMQVMPFWVSLIGDEDSHNLFNLRTNLRYGCVILRHYLDIERGDLFRALGRYNGSLGRAQYPNKVLRTWTRNWRVASDQPVVRKASGEAPSGKSWPRIF